MPDMATNKFRRITMLIISYSRRYRSCKSGNHEASLHVTQILSTNSPPNMTWTSLVVLDAVRDLFSWSFMVVTNHTQARVC